MKHIIIILTLSILSSCGGESETAQERNCTTNISDIKKAWTLQSNGLVYDLSTCDENTLCQSTFDGACGNDINDIEFLYNGSGGFYLEYCVGGAEISGNWRVCEGQLELYNTSTGEQFNFN